MRRLLMVLAVLLSSAALNAQENPKYELFGGYSWLHNSNLQSNPDFNGWEASAQYNVNHWFGIKADFSGHYQFFHEKLGSFSVFRVQTNEYDYLFGPQLSFRRKRGTLFAHGLIGATHQYGHFNRDFSLPPPFDAGNSFHFSNNSFAFAIGGGGDWNLSKRFAWRVAQVDYLRRTGFDFREGNLRLSTGLVFRFGSH
jgi:hypothetical protein